jgi:hypothetical protein
MDKKCPRWLCVAGSLQNLSRKVRVEWPAATAAREILATIYSKLIKSSSGDNGKNWQLSPRYLLNHRATAAAREYLAIITTLLVKSSSDGGWRAKFWKRYTQS